MTGVDETPSGAVGGVSLTVAAGKASVAIAGRVAGYWRYRAAAGRACRRRKAIGRRWRPNIGHPRCCRTFGRRPWRRRVGRRHWRPNAVDGGWRCRTLVSQRWRRGKRKRRGKRRLTSSAVEQPKTDRQEAKGKQRSVFHSHSANRFDLKSLIA